MSKIKIDLHVHTNYSDGAYHPFEVVRKAKERGLSKISITDHDTVDGIDKAIYFAKEVGLEIIPGVEISTDIDDTEIHILGLFIDYKSKELNEFLDFVKNERVYRAKKIITKLNELGIDIKFDDVLKITKQDIVGRLHIAYALVELKVVNNIWDAFEKFLKDGAPAYEKKIHVSPKSALQIIKDAGGLSFIAHPTFLKDYIVKDLINIGVDGIEVKHPSMNRDSSKYYNAIANEYFLLKSGGSDFHGGNRNDEGNLGNYWIDQFQFNALKYYLEDKN